MARRSHKQQRRKATKMSFVTNTYSEDVIAEENSDPLKAGFYQISVPAVSTNKASDFQAFQATFKVDVVRGVRLEIGTQTKEGFDTVVFTEVQEDSSEDGPISLEEALKKNIAHPNEKNDEYWGEFLSGRLKARIRYTWKASSVVTTAKGRSLTKGTVEKKSWSNDGAGLEHSSDPINVSYKQISNSAFIGISAMLEEEQAKKSLRAMFPCLADVYWINGEQPESA